MYNKIIIYYLWHIEGFIHAENSLVAWSIAAAVQLSGLVNLFIEKNLVFKI